MTDSFDARPTCSVPGCSNEVDQTYAKHHPKYPHWRRSYWIHNMYPETTNGDPFCCRQCHQANTARKNGVKSAYALTKKRTIKAKKLGFKSIQEMDDYNRMQKCVAHGFTEQQYRDADEKLRTAMASGYPTVTAYATALNQKLAEAAGFTRIADWKNSTHPYRYILNEVKCCQNHDGRNGFYCHTTAFLPGQLQVDHIDGNHENNNRDNLQVLCSNCHDVKTSLFKDILPWDKKPDEVYEMIQLLTEVNRDVNMDMKAQLTLF